MICIDDILIYSKSEINDKKHVKIVLDKLKCLDLNLNKEKSKFITK